MKTFGELKVGDKVYSLSYNGWGNLTEHTVTAIERNDSRSIITVKGYIKHQIVGDTENQNADLELFVNNKSEIGEVAPSIDGVMKFWFNKKTETIKRLFEGIMKK